MDAKDIRNLSEAYMEVYASQEELDEAEGSYGQTPKAHAAFASLAAKRQQKPASQYPQRGAKTKAVASAEKHTERSKPTPAHRGRGPMDDESREWSRERSEVYGGESVSNKGGSVTKNPKKLRKQKAMGEIGEQVDIYDIILSHLLDEGYAETVEAAEVIMVNMSEEWRESIVEAVSGGSYYDLPGVVIRAASGAASKLLNRGQPPAAKPKPHPSDSKLVDVSTADKAAKNLPGSRVYRERQQQQSR